MKQCDCYRGLLISDHLSKAFTCILDEYVDPLYNRTLPQTQCGAARAKGTDLANHLVRSALDYARGTGRSIFVLYIDLIKAFDFALGEIVAGWPRNSLGTTSLF